MAENLFYVSDLRVTYGRGKSRVDAVKGVSFELAEGESVGIVGESGSGKSSLVKTLMLLQPASGGSFMYKGSNALAFTRLQTKAYRREVQMVFQDAVGSLNPRMTVRQTLAEALKVAGGEGPGRIGELLALTGLSESVLDQYPLEMSGGQCQRASFARALATRPRVIVADEPVSALDVSVQARILNLLRELQKKLGIAVVLISHDLAVVKNVCDRVCVMKEGLFVEQGDAGQVLGSPRHAYTQHLLAAVPDVRRALGRRAAADARGE